MVELPRRALLQVKAGSFNRTENLHGEEMTRRNSSTRIRIKMTVLATAVVALVISELPVVLTGILMVNQFVKSVQASIRPRIVLLLVTI